MSTLLSIPLEIRLIIYAKLLSDHKDTIVHNNQPTNAHLVLLHTCRQVEHEAGDLAGFRAYLSLRHEREISAFLDKADRQLASRVTHLDVANDGRLVQHPKSDGSTPASALYRVFEMLPALVSLRVFDCHRTRALHEFVSGARFVWSFEAALFPQRKQAGLTSFEYYIYPMTKTVVLHSVSGESIRRLRLSGLIRLDAPLEESCRHLKDFTICGVTGNYFDQRPLTGMEAISLESFQYSQGSPLGFEMQMVFLSSVLAGSYGSLRKLVLLQCSKLATTGLAASLELLVGLEYFALSLITVNELDSNLVSGLAHSMRILKLKITHTRYTKPFVKEEQAICAALKRRFTTTATPILNFVYLHLPHVISGPSEEREWTVTASDYGVQLCVGDWEPSEII